MMVLSLVLLVAILFMLILVYLQLLRMRGTLRKIARRKRNKVVVPSLTLVVDAASYLHGDTVKISGILAETDPMGGTTVVLVLPDGTSQNVTTDANGKYSASWVVPETVSGLLTLTATALGVTATTTFTLKNCKEGMQ